MKSMLAYATSVQERMGPLSLSYDGKVMDDNLSQWLSRKSLCTEELFDLSLQEWGMTRENFNMAIKSLEENDIQLLSEECKKMFWYQRAIEIFDDEKAYQKTPEVMDFSFAIRPFLHYLKKEMEKVTVKSFTISGVDAFYIHLAEEFVQISSKTLVYDLHEQKKKFVFKGETSNERFIYYMKKRFGNKASLLEFYEDYPVLFRLLTERVLFHINNYKEFVQSIEQSLPDFATVFSLSAPYQISEISVGAGDSHGKGKTVILFDMNGHRFAFKYKNLEIGKRFNSFLSYLEKQTGKEFFKIKRIVNKHYCIEEFVSNQECKTEEDIRKFYHRFGEYVALAYLLCGNDFHYENVIAHGEFPVLIDIETLIQNDGPVRYADNPYIELSVKKYSSVLASALLPFKVYGNRVEPLAEGGAKGQGLRISAFDGKKQKSPYKGLSLINVNSDEVRFEYVEYELNGSNNIPVFDGKEVNAERYKPEVVKGFDEICEYFRTNSKEVLLIIEDIFSDVIVRNVIKTTQKYVDMLGYGYHPKCMKDYIEREKLFENLWAFEYKNKSAILPEIKDLLVNDVPIFYNNTSSRDLITSNGELLENYYKRTAMDRVKERVMNFDEKEYQYQKLRLELSLGIYELQSEVINLGTSTEEVLNRIVDTIYSRAKYDTKKNSVAFEDFIYELDGTLDYGPLNAEFYDGLSGIYLFVLYYAKSYPSPKVERLKLALEKSLFKLPGKKGNRSQLSAYGGKYSVLYPLFHKYKLEGNDEDLLLAENFLIDLADEVDQNADADWLNGVSGLIQVLLDYYRLTKKSHFLEKAEMLSKVWDKNEVELCGFAHGFSGIIYASYSLYCETGKQNHISRVQEYLKKENQYFDGRVWKDLREGKNAVSHWCHGTVGIGITRLHLLQCGFDEDQVREDLINCVNDVMAAENTESGICHGNMGRFLFLKEVQQSQLVPKEIQIQIDNSLSKILHSIFNNGVVVDSFENQSVLGLMTGITGIGYGLLKEMNLCVPNILGLE